jgi:hypothetical protein
MHGVRFNRIFLQTSSGSAAVAHVSTPLPVRGIAYLKCRKNTSELFFFGNLIEFKKIDALCVLFLRISLKSSA